MHEFFCDLNLKWNVFLLKSNSRCLPVKYIIVLTLRERFFLKIYKLRYFICLYFIIRNLHLKYIYINTLRTKYICENLANEENGIFKTICRVLKKNLFFSNDNYSAYKHASIMICMRRNEGVASEKCCSFFTPFINEI